MRRRWAHLGWLASAALPAACRTEATFDAVPPISEADMAAVIAEAVCAQRLACDCYDPLTGPVGEDPAAATLAQCLESRRLEVAYWQAQAEGLKYDGFCLAERLEAMKAWGCADYGHVRALMGEGDGSCTRSCRVFHGLTRRGEPCEESSLDDCGQGLVCRYYPDPDGIYPETARCADPCLDLRHPCGGELCAPSQYCGTGGCQTSPQLGDECQGWCGGLAACLPDGDGVARCQPLLEDGEACEVFSGCLGECIDGICASGSPLVCSWDVRTDD